MTIWRFRDQNLLIVNQDCWSYLKMYQGSGFLETRCTFVLSINEIHCWNVLNIGYIFALVFCWCSDCCHISFVRYPAEWSTSYLLAIYSTSLRVWTLFSLMQTFQSFNTHCQCINCQLSFDNLPELLHVVGWVHKVEHYCWSRNAELLTVVSFQLCVTKWCTHVTVTSSTTEMMVVLLNTADIAMFVCFY